MSKLLLVIDVQRDFINEYTVKKLEDIQSLVDSGKYDIVAFTRFINDENSILYNKLNYKGCMTKEQQEIMLNTYDYKIFDKKTYTAVNEELRKYISDNNINQIYICGFDTDACVQKTALDLFEQGYNVCVLKDYCMCGQGEELHKEVIKNLKRLIGNDGVR